MEKEGEKKMRNERVHCGNSGGEENSVRADGVRGLTPRLTVRLLMRQARCQLELDAKSRVAAGHS